MKKCNACELTEYYKKYRERQLSYHKHNRIIIHKIAFNKNHCANKLLAELLIEYKYITMELKNKFSKINGHDQLYGRIWNHAKIKNKKIR